VFTEKGQDAGFPDKEGLNFVNIKRYGPDVYRGNKYDSTRPNPSSTSGTSHSCDASALSFHRPFDRGSGTPLIVANPNPNGYVNPVMEWDTNNPMDGLAGRQRHSRPGDTIFTAVFGIIDNGPENLRPMWRTIVKTSFLNRPASSGRSLPEPSIRSQCLSEEGKTGAGSSAPRRRSSSMDGKTMYVCGLRELYVNYQMESPFYTSQIRVVWTITKQ